jgi:hypothetical protein
LDHVLRTDDLSFLEVFQITSKCWLGEKYDKVRWSQCFSKRRYTSGSLGAGRTWGPFNSSRLLGSGHRTTLWEARISAKGARARALCHRAMWYVRGTECLSLKYRVEEHSDKVTVAVSWRQQL